MGLIDNEYALQVSGVFREINARLVLCKSLYIYHCDFRLAAFAFKRLVRAELLHQLLAAVSGAHDEATRLELL